MGIPWQLILHFHWLLFPCWEAGFRTLLKFSGRFGYCRRFGSYTCDCHILYRSDSLEYLLLSFGVTLLLFILNFLKLPNLFSILFRDIFMVFSASFRNSCYYCRSFTSFSIPPMNLIQKYLL
jgi:hypothetical protein